MKKRLTGIITVWVLLLLWSCGGGENEKTEAFIPVNSIIKGQINHIDTSLFTIIKVTYVDTLHSDTDYVRREDVRELAKDFLTIPDLSKKKYTEVNIPGPLEGWSTFTYKPVNPDKEELKQIDLIIDPSLEIQGKSQITTIIIERMFSNRDSSVDKKLLWQMDKSFQVTTIKQLPGQPEVYSSYKVIWKGVSDE
jgi:hypothetical protein